MHPPLDPKPRAQQLLRVKIKKVHKNAVIPKYAKEGDAGLDLVATSMRNAPYGRVEYGTGISIEIPPGYVGLVFPRSSISKTDLMLTNSVGVIDSGFRGEIRLRFTRKPYGDSYEIGDRIGQLVIIPHPRIEFVECTELDESARGTGGFGSTGR